LASAIAPLVPDTDPLVAALEAYEEIYLQKYRAMMANKLGLDEVRTADIDLFAQFEKTLARVKPDMTIFHQLLMDLPADLENEPEVINYFKECFYNEPEADKRAAFFSLIKTYAERLKTNTVSREAALERMQKANPRFILRNYLLHQAIEELEKGENSLFMKLQEAMKDPYSRKFDEFLAKRPNWASRKAGCSMLSCSS
jgi:uncharacterized protein YdiU (UPF0061 family)